MCKIKIVDAICGSGKTSAAIEYMKKRTDANFIYVTPFLSEIERVKKACTPRRFYDPKAWGKKIDSFNQLIKKGSNIATTHALFRGVEQDTRDMLSLQNYILILDEVMSVVEPLDITRSDLDIILKNGLAHIDEEKYLVWDADSYKGEYNRIKNMSKNRNIVVVNNVALLWNFPVTVFDCFEEVWILTYIFDGQVQKSYFDYHGIEYEYYGVNKDMTDFTKGKHTSELKYGHLIDVYEGKYNTIGDNTTALSKTWYINAKKDILDIFQKTIYNYFKLHTKSKTTENMWTTFRDFKSKIKGEGYTRGFVSCNARATNEHKHKTCLAYCINRYNNPLIKSFFQQKDIKFDEDNYALSELIQWIFRSQLRDKKPIQIYIPSKRMRNLLLEWMKTN